MPEFSLQTVLEYRHSVVEGLEIELSVLLNKEQQIQKTIDNLNSTKENLLEEMKVSQQGSLDMERLQQMRDNVKYLKIHIEDHHKQLENVGTEVSNKREELTTAKQEEEVLIKLKEKVMNDFQEKVNKADNELQDDIYISQAYQRSMNSKAEDSNA